MKTFIAVICSLFLVCCASFGATLYQAITFSGVLYVNSTGGKVKTVVVNNSYLIQLLASVSQKDVHLYDVAINKSTDEIDVISKTSGFVATVMEEGIFASVENGENTEQYITASISLNLGPYYGGGTAWSLIKYNSSGAVTSDSIHFIAGETEALNLTAPSEVVHGTCVTRAKQYSFQ